MWLYLNTGISVEGHTHTNTAIKQCKLQIPLIYQSLGAWEYADYNTSAVFPRKPPGTWLWLTSLMGELMEQINEVVNFSHIIVLPTTLSATSSNQHTCLNAEYTSLTSNKKVWLSTDYVKALMVWVSLLSGPLSSKWLKLSTEFGFGGMVLFWAKNSLLFS